MMDGPRSGTWNMALDEALLAVIGAAAHPLPVLRFYQWSEPTVSLGYFQSIDDLPAALDGLPVVRRLTGGGAIVHDRELTYSVHFPARQWPRADFRDLVVDVHDVLADLVGLQRPVEPTHPPEPFLCFERRHPQDLEKRGRKIVGSAQRSRRGSLLQHGSILLEASPWTPHLKGLSEFGIDWSDSIDARAHDIARRLAERWGWKALPTEPTADEVEQAEALAREKYGDDSWTRKR